MSFNSKLYPVFFALIVVAYFTLPHRHRWKLLLAGSYVFYMCWSVKYISWLLAITLIDYFCALRMGRREGRRGRLPWLLLSVGANLALLIIFKYSGFVSDQLRSLTSLLHVPYDVPAFSILLPLGISFHTLQTLGYSLDVYRGTREPERHLGLFALYVSFFPQLVAGPIERSTHLLPQFRRHNRFEYERVAQGLQMILWGMFKKVVIADRLSVYVNAVYAEPGHYGAIPTIIATYFFAFQIYCDFSGYSDIAIGSARVLGYDLTVNFRRPYAAGTVRDFWRRWHISLSTWFRDYVYVPLGGGRVPLAAWARNVLIVFLLSGLWHGANWTFCVWGLLHGFYYVSSAATRGLRERAWALAGVAPAAGLRRAAGVFFTFQLVCFAWVFFRAGSLSEAGRMLAGLSVLGPAPGVRTGVLVGGLSPAGLAFDCALVLLLLAAERASLGGEVASRLRGQPLPWRWAASYAMLFAILTVGAIAKNEFIYFQF